MWKYRRFVQFAVGAALLMAGVVDANMAAAAEACLPADVTAPSVVSQQISKTTMLENARLYIDASGSMIGYVRQSAQKDESHRIYPDLLLTLPQSMGQLARNVEYFKFGSKIVSMRPQEITAAAQPKFYSCEQGSAGCINQESRIADVLTLIAAEPVNSISVIATDLFLSGEEVFGSHSAALRLPITKALRSGQAIGIWGIRSRFSGTIYDLPSGGQYKEALSRPVFLLVIGPTAHVIGLQRMLQIELLNEIPAAHHHFSLFSQNFLRTVGSIDQLPLDTLIATRVQPVRGLVSDADWLPQLRLGVKHEGVQWLRPWLDLVMPASAGIAKVDVRASLWLKQDDRIVCENRWQKLDIDGLVTATRTDEGLKLSIFSDAATLEGLPSRKTYLLNVQVQATQAAMHTTSKSWLRAWSFEARDEERLLKEKPKFFPALNLHRLTAVLDGIIQEGFVHSIISDFSLAFERQR